MSKRKNKRKKKNATLPPPTTTISTINPTEEAIFLIDQAKRSKSTDIHIHTESLTELPSSIGSLNNLETLCLHSNHLSSLPNEIKNLKKLRAIILHGNKFTEIPPVLYEMSWLHSIDLRENLIKDIDDRIMNFAYLKKLYLKGNRFGAPEEIFEQSPKEVINFLINLKQGKNSSLNEIKMILLGEANVGKTALVERLINNTFTGNTGITKGIDIKKWKLGSYKVNIWDFGGQEIMRAMHQFFMTERTLYLLLWNSREDDTNGKIEDWLELIKTYGGKSPVILVISRCDDGNFDPDEHRLLDDYKDNIKAILRTSARDDIGIFELRDRILEIIKELNILKDQIPNNWISIKKEVEKIQKNYINLNEYYEICKSKGVVKNEEQISLLRLLKDLGVAFNYGDKENPHTTNILKPEWVTKGIYDIINSNELFQKQGKVLLSDIKSILKKSGEYDEKEEVIIGLMKQFELCFTVCSDEYLIPDLLPEKQPYIGNEFNDSLQLQYQYEYMAKSIMPHFIAKVNDMTRHLEGDESWYWRAGIIIENGENKALIKLNKRKKILFIYVIGEKENRRELLDNIREELGFLHEKIRGKKPRLIVPLPDNPNYSVSYKSLLQLERQGQSEIFIEDYGYAEIKPLLNGIETPEQRKLTFDNFKDLYKTQQIKDREERTRKNKMLVEQTKKKQQKIEKSISQQEKLKNQLENNSNHFASKRKRIYNKRFVAGILLFGFVTVFLAIRFETLRFIVPIISLVIALIMIILNAIGVKYSSKYCYDKWYTVKYKELNAISGFDENKLIELNGQLEDSKRKIKEIETQIECM